MTAGGQIGFDLTGYSAIRPENPTLEPNMKSIRWSVAEISPYLRPYHSEPGSGKKWN